MWFSANTVNIKPVADVWVRFERRQNRDFNGATSDDQSQFPFRIRGGVEITGGKQLSGRLTFQAAQTLTQVKAGDSWVVRNDLFEGFAKAKTEVGTFTLGRQVVVKGNQRLVGPSNWSNIGRSWDAVRYEHDGWDLFFGRLAVDARPNADARFGFLGKTWSAGETLFLQKWDDRAPYYDSVSTVSHRWANKNGLTAEGMLQTKRGDFAWAAVVRSEAKLGKVTQGYLEAAVASGGRKDGRSTAFDQLYPTNHAAYGIMDVAGLKNILMVTFGATHRVTPAFSLSAELSPMWLYAANDGWYNSGGNLIGRGAGLSYLDPTGKSGRELGQELSLEGTYKLPQNLTFSAGISYFRPGEFVRNLTPDEKPQIWSYAMLGWKF